MREHEIDHEYEIIHPTTHFGERVKETLGTVFARNTQEAIQAAREEFGRGLGKLRARLVS